jgi:hypothetical protein
MLLGLKLQARQVQAGSSFSTPLSAARAPPALNIKYNTDVKRATQRLSNRQVAWTANYYLLLGLVLFTNSSRHDDGEKLSGSHSHDAS